MESANKNADSSYNLWTPLTICRFHLEIAGSTYKLRIPLTVTDSSSAQFNDTGTTLNSQLKMFFFSSS